MPRPVKTDRATALDAAMRLFWQRTFESVSVEELVDATGMSRSSLYATFGSKEGLFTAALERYLEQVSVRRLALLRTPGSAKAALVAYFDDLLAFSTGPQRKLGCLLVTSAVEIAPFHEGVSRRLQDSFGEVHKELEALLVRAQAQGELAPHRDTAELARLLLAAIQGIRVLARSGADDAELRQVVNGALAALR